MNIFIKYFAGTKKIRVECPVPSRLCGFLMSEFPLCVFCTGTDNDCSFEFVCLSLHEKRIRKFLDNFECIITEISRKGFPYFVMRFGKKLGLCAGMFMICSSMFFNNSTVWDIEIQGNDRIGSDEIENNLLSVGFGIGKGYKKAELSAISNSFILMDDRFTRIAINMSGNKAFVEVTERTKKYADTEDSADKGMISAYDCVIERPEIIHGTSLVKKGNVIQKGSMIVSPIEKGTGENEYFSGAIGKVYAKTVEYFTVIIPYNSIAVNENGENADTYTISFLSDKLTFRNFVRKPVENFLVSFLAQRAEILNGVELPFKVRKTEKRSYSVSERRLSSENAEKKAYEKMYLKISEELAECEILSEEYAFEEKENFAVLRCRIECVRNVAVYP